MVQTPQTMMDFPPRVALVAMVLSAVLISSISALQLGCEQLCFIAEQPPAHCACNEGDTLPKLQDLQQVLKKAATHNQIFKWGRKRSIDDALDTASSDAYAPQEVQRRIFRWGKRSAPVQNQIFRWGKRAYNGFVARSPSYGDLSSTDVLRLEEAIRQGRMDYYDVLAGSDVPVGKRRNMDPAMQNHIFKWGKRDASQK